MHFNRRFVRRAACAIVAALCLTTTPAPRVQAAGAPSRALLDADLYLQKYELISIDPVETLRQVRGAGRITIEAGLDRFELELEPHDLRARRYRAEETLEDGTVRTLPSAPVQTYAGRVLNHEGGIARFTIDERRVSGLIIVGDERFFVEPLGTFSLAGGPTDYVVYRESDVRPEAEPGTCGITEAHKVGTALDGVAAQAAEALVDSVSTVQLATEADNEYVSTLGSAQAANQDILTVVNQVDGVYQAEVGLTFQVVLQNTYAGSDPYSSTTNPSNLLVEFRNYWNANRAGVARDVTHMWTGKDMDSSTIGIAYVGVVCNSPSYSYGISQRYTPTPQRYVLTAHELGHNFDADHSNAQSGCTNTIMQSSVGTGFSFCQFSRDQITSHAAANGSCLTGGSTPTPPAAPSNLSATAVSQTQINLSWADNSTNETGFRVERSTNGSSFVQIATVGAGATSYASTGLRRNRLYYYRVRAYNASGNSAYSNTASARTPR
jgi:hypothetical protein